MGDRPSFFAKNTAVVTKKNSRIYFPWLGHGHKQVVLNSLKHCAPQRSVMPTAGSIYAHSLCNTR